MTTEEKHRLTAFHAACGQPERLTTIRTTSHVFEFDRIDGTLRIASAANPEQQQFLSSAETALLLEMLYNLRNEILK